MVNKMLYGGDYNPEQWDEAVWEEDMRMFRLAGIDCVTLNVFSWAALQPDEVTYRFERLDKIMELVRKNDLKVVMATSTAAHPAWMAKKYPEVLRTEFSGIRRKFGSRHNSCPNSPVYQKYSVALARKLAERYGTCDNIVAWHISNEYGGECYCENCEKAFRVWLKEKYGSMEALNKAWNTSFWGHTFYDWDEIVVPNLQSEHFAQDRTTFQGISLDYRRFNSDSMLRNYLGEYEAVKAVTPHIPVTTNLMGFYKPLDYQKWARYMDLVSWDNYPNPTDPPALVAMRHDLMRGLKQGAPFMLMEQTPSVTNWQPYNLLKRPGEMRLISYQAVAHGADTVMFFQMRRSIGACEKFHGAVIDHVGTEHTRVFREVSRLGAELEQLGAATLDARTPSRVAMLVDWDNWWALEYSAGPSCDLKYMDELANYYTALYDRNISVDIISAEDSLDGYQVVIAPVLYMTKPGTDEKIRRFVSAGGTFVTTFLSGLVDENDLVFTGGYPGKLRDILGIWVEETDALPAYMKNSFSWNGKEYESGVICDIMHMEHAKALACYDKDFYKGTPVLSRNELGEGFAYYVATRSGGDFYADFLEMVLQEQNITPVFKPCAGVEITLRQKDGTNFLFFLNHNSRDEKLTAEKPGTDLLTGKQYHAGDDILLPAKGVVLFKEGLPC